VSSVRARSCRPLNSSVRFLKEMSWQVQSRAKVDGSLMKNTQSQSTQLGAAVCSASFRARLMPAGSCSSVWSSAVQAHARRLARASGRMVGFAIQSSCAIPRPASLAGVHVVRRVNGWSAQSERNLTTRCTGPGRGVASRTALCGEHRCTIHSSGTLVARSGELKR